MRKDAFSTQRFSCGLLQYFIRRNEAQYGCLFEPVMQKNAGGFLLMMCRTVEALPVWIVEALQRIGNGRVRMNSEVFC